MTKVWDRWAPFAVVALVVVLGPSPAGAVDITVKVRSLEGVTIEEETKEKTPQETPALQMRVTNATKGAEGQDVTVTVGKGDKAQTFNGLVPVGNGDSITFSVPAGTDAVRLQIDDTKSILLSAVVDALLTNEKTVKTQEVTLVMPERGPADNAGSPPAVVDCPPPCPCYPPAPCGRRLFNFRRH
jgi:hypothetical protein